MSPILPRHKCHRTLWHDAVPLGPDASLCRTASAFFQLLMILHLLLPILCFVTSTCDFLCSLSAVFVCVLCASCGCCLCVGCVNRVDATLTAGRCSAAAWRGCLVSSASTPILTVPNDTSRHVFPSGHQPRPPPRHRRYARAPRGADCS